MSIKKSTIETFETKYPFLAEEYKVLLKEQYEQFASKMLDYGVKNIAQGTDLETKEEKKFALTAIFIRMNDKMARWKNLMLSGNEVNNEPLIDTYKDLANYSIIAQLVDLDKWKK